MIPTSVKNIAVIKETPLLAYSFAPAAHFNFLLFRRSFSILRSHLELQK
jgi:hypothetical protein